MGLGLRELDFSAELVELVAEVVDLELLVLELLPVGLFELIDNLDSEHIVVQRGNDLLLEVLKLLLALFQGPFEALDLRIVVLLQLVLLLLRGDELLVEVIVVGSELSVLRLVLFVDRFEGVEVVWG